VFSNNYAITPTAVPGQVMANYFAAFQRMKVENNTFSCGSFAGVTILYCDFNKNTVVYDPEVLTSYGVSSVESNITSNSITTAGVATGAALYHTLTFGGFNNGCMLTNNLISGSNILYGMYVDDASNAIISNNSIVAVVGTGIYIIGGYTRGTVISNNNVGALKCIDILDPDGAGAKISILPPYIACYDNHLKPTASNSAAFGIRYSCAATIRGNTIVITDPIGGAPPLLAGRGIVTDYNRPGIDGLVITDNRIEGVLIGIKAPIDVSTRNIISGNTIYAAYSATLETVNFIGIDLDYYDHALSISPRYSIVNNNCIIKMTGETSPKAVGINIDGCDFVSLVGNMIEPAVDGSAKEVWYSRIGNPDTIGIHLSGNHLGTGLTMLTPNFADHNMSDVP
jgi:hypothetical protein